jgi:hypothetical protein
MSTPSFIIVADRGSLKAFAIEDTPTRGPMPRLAQAFQVSAKPGRMSDQYTDQAGAFPNGGSKGQGNSIAERLSIDEELSRRAYREVARHIEDLISQHSPKTWGFAAPSEINRAILEDLKPDTKSNLKKVVNRDLIHASADELLTQFLGK